MDWATGQNNVLSLIKNSNKNVIVNSSLGYGDFSCDTLLSECILPDVRSWIKRVRGSVLYETGTTGPESLENKFLHCCSAGNIGQGPPNPEAALSGVYKAARLMPGLDTEKGVSLDNLNNTLVIENRSNSSDQPYKADCLAASSKYPGDLSAIGSEVYSLTGSSSGADNKTGTSMSSPQTAGLAAYVWALKPGLTPQGLLTLLVYAARDYPSGCSPTPQPVIDAYNAVLAVDDASALEGAGSPSEARVRTAILDVVDADGNLGGNGVFDEKDVEHFVYLYSTSEPSVDYSRFDLNGDGWTGGGCDTTAMFNLDIDYPPTYDIITQNIHGDTVTFDEANVTDMHVLCYYAFSPIYTGDEALRDAIMESHLGECAACGGEEPPPTPWLEPPEIDGRGDIVGATVELGSAYGTDYEKNCYTSQSSHPTTSTLSTGCLTSTQGVIQDETASEEIDAYYVGPFGASWSFTSTTDSVESTATVEGSSNTSVALTESELVIQGSLAANASATSTAYDWGTGDATAIHWLHFKVPVVLYELTWGCNLSLVHLYAGTRDIVKEGGAPTYKVESCEKASGSLIAGEYYFRVEARVRAGSWYGSAPDPQTRDGSFQLVLKPPPPPSP